MSSAWARKKPGSLYLQSSLKQPRSRDFCISLLVVVCPQSPFWFKCIVGVDIVVVVIVVGVVGDAAAEPSINRPSSQIIDFQFLLIVQKDLLSPLSSFFLSECNGLIFPSYFGFRLKKADLWTVIITLRLLLDRETCTITTVDKVLLALLVRTLNILYVSTTAGPGLTLATPLSTTKMRTHASSTSGLHVYVLYWYNVARKYKYQMNSHNL